MYNRSILNTYTKTTFKLQQMQVETKKCVYAFIKDSNFSTLIFIEILPLLLFLSLHSRNLLDGLCIFKIIKTKLLQ
jgi:hypothetical protein